MLASMPWLAEALSALSVFLQNHPEICLFLAIAVGFYIGAKKIGPVQLGGVCGTLLVALLLGQSGVHMPADVKSIFFAMFIFSLGYLGGPQFFSSLNAKGLRLGIFSVTEMLCVLGLALAASKIFHFDPGTTAGLVAGSATESAVIGTASEAISRLGLDDAALATMQANVATAYSLTYIFGLITIVVFTSQVAPMLLRVNLADEADKLWKSMGGSDLADASEGEDVITNISGRVYAVDFAAGKTVGEIEAALGQGAHIERISRDVTPIDVTPETRLERGDFVTLVGARRKVMQGAALLGEERDAGPFLNLVLETEEYLATKETSAGKKLREVNAALEKLELDGHVHCAAVIRNGNAMPLVPGLEIEEGDIIRLLGSHADIDAARALIGRRINTGTKTNFIYVALGIILGILIGRISIPLGSIALSLGTGGGALLTGLVFGWLQAKKPSIPATSPAALALLKDLGLAAFVACIGLSSGKQAISLVGQYGLILPLTGIVLVLVPACISLLVGRFVLRLEAPVLLGGIAGQQCSTPALSAVQAAAGNTTPLLGYTITYAISNVLLPLLGPILVGLTSAGA